MDRFQSLRLFTRIIELGSFSRAADDLELPRATATHSIQALEARLKTRLLERTTRQVRPTLDGQAFYERCVQILNELEDAENSLLHASTHPKGTLRVDLHGTHAIDIVLPRIDEFRSRYPGIDFIVSSGDRLVDLVRDGIDCVVRAGVPKDSTLVSRRLAVMPEVVCASPEYLALHGTPRHPDELLAHHAVGFFTSDRNIHYPFELTVDGGIREYELPAWMSVSDAENYVVCALRGCGLVQLPRFHVEHYLKDGRLVELLAEWPSNGVPVSVMYPQHRQLSQRVRVFIDWLTALYTEKFGAPEHG
jgi:DNA-binding transcriptional LysR family regulator